MGKVYMFNEKNLKQCIIYMRVRKSGRALELAVGCSESTPPLHRNGPEYSPRGAHVHGGQLLFSVPGSSNQISNWRRRKIHSKEQYKQNENL